MANGQEAFKEWALIEIMGHQRLAGFCSEQVIGGTPMIRVDVPEIEGDAQGTSYTTFLGASSIYRLTPVSEQVASGTVVGGIVPGGIGLGDDPEDRGPPWPL